VTRRGLLGAFAARRRPNIVFVLADDLGYGELGCYGNRFNETPNLDRLASDGVRFTQAYAAAPVCSPTRVSLMVGQHPARVGILDYLRADDPNHLSPKKYDCVARRLKAAGYRTGLVGKWHLMGDYSKRRGDPKLHGFDEVICSESRYIGPGYYNPPYEHMPEVAPKTPNEYLTDRLNDEAVDFVNRDAGRPFFLYLSHYAPHTRLVSRADHEARFRAKAGASEKRNNPRLAGMLASIDEGIGMLRRKLEQSGEWDNTLFVFASDNGGEDRVTVNGALRAGKSTLYEGGIRIPLMAKLPGKRNAGVLCTAPVSTLDVMPEFLRNGGAPLSWELEGRPILDAVTGAKDFARRPLYWHYPLDKPHFLGGRSAGAVRQGDWKLIRFYDDKSEELFHLRADPGEAKNLIAAHPERARELRASFMRWQAALP
jgi:arylsulfatase A